MPHNFDEIIPRDNTNSLKYDDKLNRFGTLDVQPMWVADMDFRVSECITTAFTELVSHGIYGYHIKIDRYYQAIINWFRQRHSYSIDQKGIFFTPGVVPAVNYLVQAFTKKGDKIIVQPPVYFPFFWLVQLNNRQILYNQLVEKNNEYSIDFDDFENKAKEAGMFIFCHPHNPVGRAWRRDELEKIADICLRHKVIIVSDEIHNDLVFAPNRHIPIASLSPEIDNITITCHSASKTFNLAGLSTAYAIMNNDEMQKIFKGFLSLLHVEALNTFGLTAMATAFEQGGSWLDELLQYLWGNYEYVKDYLENNLPALKVSPLEATYMLWLDFRKLQMSDKKLKEFIIKKAHLGLNDGPTFGIGGQGFQRINIACPKQLVSEALEKLKIALS
jgi:cysteine-S-conjugate beta-lyase